MYELCLNKISQVHQQCHQKLPEIRQKDNETLVQYVKRCAEVLLGLK
jgi:hypothetical protein